MAAGAVITAVASNTAAAKAATRRAARTPRSGAPITAMSPPVETSRDAGLIRRPKRMGRQAGQPEIYGARNPRFEQRHSRVTKMGAGAKRTKVAKAAIRPSTSRRRSRAARMPVKLFIGPNPARNTLPGYAEVSYSRHWLEVRRFVSPSARTAPWIA
ncbi:hypothetical protein GCM10022255_010690 [Dactylosporangium darangshiense]|uniref:Uncharacterized protein n=1 Tax=Dactylosporangium darangshiense TaxID=579108 RepID=A0ABP8CZT4_9ACTN